MSCAGIRRCSLLAAVWHVVGAGLLVAASPGDLLRSGTATFETTADEGRVAPRFHLDAHEFSFEERFWVELPEHWSASRVTFPSPVKTPHEMNNTVHCEYFRPTGKPGPKAPAVIVLHILGGDFELSRFFCHALAQRGTAAMFVKLPYYGERRDPKVERRMISKEPRETVEGMTQAILDIRRAAAWLATREEIDPKRIGIFGISLGGITGALATCSEPRIGSACLLLAGGDIGRVAWEAPELEKIRAKWLATGGTREQFMEHLRAVDPVVHAAGARGKRILMLNADRDEVIPKACTESLWKSLGEPEIHWYRGGHYSVIWHMPDAVERVSNFFAP